DDGNTSGFRNLACSLECSISADANEAFELFVEHSVLHGVHAALNLVGMAASRSAHRPADHKDPGDVLAGQRAGITIDHALPTVAKPHDRATVLRRASLDDRTNGRVESWAVAAACQKSNTHGHTLPGLNAPRPANWSRVLRE